MIFSLTASKACMLAAIAALSLCLISHSQMASARTSKSAPTPAAVTVKAKRPDDAGCKNCIATAASLFAQGKNTQAADMLRTWSDRCPNATQLHLMLSTILLRTGDLTGAEEAAAAAAESAPNSMGAHLQFGLAAMGNHHFVKAKQEFTRVTELSPSSYEGWSALSMVSKELHADSESAQAAAKAADLEPSTKSARMSTLLSLKRAGKFLQAKGELKRLLTDNASSAEITEELAKEALLIGAFDEAATASKRVADAYPKAPNPLIMLALAHYCLKDFNSCASDADMLLTLEPTSNEGGAMKAMALAKLNKLDEAKSALKDINATDSASSIVMLGKGTVDFLAGSYEESENMLQNCLETDSSNATMQGIPHALAHMTLRDLYTKIGKTGQAAEQTQAIAADKRFASAIGN